MARKEDERFYSHILINKARLYGFITIFLTVFVLFSFTIARGILLRETWTGILLPLLLFGVPVMIFPMIENWEYRPWQAKAQKYERHYRD